MTTNIGGIAGMNKPIKSCKGWVHRQQKSGIRRGEVSSWRTSVSRQPSRKHAFDMTQLQLVPVSRDIHIGAPPTEIYDW
jgi:hypothetical protein